MIKNLNQHRNFGISAHIDSGKTTLSERILYYTGRIYKIEEVRGEGSGATMDHMELEKERGITITSAATSCSWDNHSINLIDTPGHVDFTVEVERSLRVLDGGVLVLCGVGGVQSQSITVDRQMKRYAVPRIAFINKLDRMGADPFKVCNALREKLALNSAMFQIPIGTEELHAGVVDLIEMKAYYFDGVKGEILRTEEIPAELQDQADEWREKLLDELSMFSDELAERVLEGEDVTPDELRAVARQAVLDLELVPVFMGSAFKNKGVQPLLDAIIHYLPSPHDRQYFVTDIPTEEKVPITADPEEPLVAMAFKLVDDPFGQLTYTRVYMGKMRKGDTIINTRTGKKARVGRLVKMHSDKREEVVIAGAGDIIAMIGVDCATGDTFCDGSVEYSCEGIHIADPVIEYSISPAKQEDASNMSKGLGRFVREDPTFRVRVDKESNETIIAGMGELHLEVYIERIRREYKANVVVGAPKVAYRETITAPSEFDYKHKKQTGGAGQYGHVVGEMTPQDEPFTFEEHIVGGAIPREFINACEKGFRDALEKGPLVGFPVTGVKIDLRDGTYHQVDSSEVAFRTASRQAFKQAFIKAKPQILEPVMMVEVETPNEFTGGVQGDLSSRRGMLLGSEVAGEGYSVIRAEVPLSEMFGYSTDLRSRTQGKASFSMEFNSYKPVPSSIQTKLMEEAQRAKAAKN